MNGVKHSEQAKIKISEARKRIGFSLEHRENISKAKRGINHHNAKKVYQFTRDKTFVKEWEYMGEAAKELHIAKSAISQCCLLHRPTAGGYVWRYNRKG